MTKVRWLWTGSAGRQGRWPRLLGSPSEPRGVKYDRLGNLGYYARQLARTSDRVIYQAVRLWKSDGVAAK